MFVGNYVNIVGESEAPAENYLALNPNPHRFWGQRQYLRANDDLQLPMLMHMPSFVPKLQSLTGRYAETIELRSHTWNTMVYNERTKEASSIQLKIHHLRPMQSPMQHESMPLPNVLAPSSYTFSRPIDAPCQLFYPVGGVELHQLPLPMQNIPQGNCSAQDSFENVPVKIKASNSFQEQELEQTKNENGFNNYNYYGVETTMMDVDMSQIGDHSYCGLIEEDPQSHEHHDGFLSDFNEPPVFVEVTEDENDTDYYVEHDGLHKILNKVNCKSGIFPKFTKGAEKARKNNTKTPKAITSKRVLHGRILKVKLEKISTPFANALNNIEKKPSFSPVPSTSKAD